VGIVGIPGKATLNPKESGSQTIDEEKKEVEEIQFITQVTKECPNPKCIRRSLMYIQ
jgi:hypothetical protein